MMAQFICEKQGRCCPHEFYDSIEQAISDSEDGVPCDHLGEVVPVRHGSIIETIEDGRMKRVFSCCGTDFTKMTCWMTPKYCPNCGAKMDGGTDKRWMS